MVGVQEVHQRQENRHLLLLRELVSAAGEGEQLLLLPAGEGHQWVPLVAVLTRGTKFVPTRLITKQKQILRFS